MTTFIFTCFLSSNFLCFAILIIFLSLEIVSFFVLCTKVTLDSLIWQDKIYDPYCAPFSSLVLFNWIIIYV
jgi:hypothetical protein